MVAFLIAALLASTVPSLAAAVGATASSRGIVGRQREGALLQTWGKTLDGSGSAASAHDTPVTRVVSLLKDMQATLTKEMDEDAALYDKLACWCNTNEYEKTNSIQEAEAKTADLSSSIEALTAKGAELKATLGQLDEDVASNKQALAAATALREKEAAEFHGQEVDSVQAIENLKAAIEVLSKHHGAALPQMSFSFLSVRGKGRKGRDSPWGADHESRLARSFDEFLAQNGFGAAGAGAEAPAPLPESSRQKFLQEHAAKAASPPAPAWSSSDVAVIKRALRSATMFMQARHGEDYYPSYSARSGEIYGLLKELKEKMEADLGAAQKTEMARAAAFAELRASKMAEIQAGEKQNEQKEDQLAQSSMDLAEAKEDLDQTQATLSEEQKFMQNLKATCEDADKNFEQRKGARLSEIKAVGETISILSADEARDTMSRTYGFLQLSSRAQRKDSRQRHAATLLRTAAAKVNNPDLSILATRVELDSFTRVKKAIDDMVGMLKKQQADEVKKHDWCNVEVHENEMATAKAEDKKADLSAKADELASTMGRLTDEVAQSKAQISQLQLDLQRATENRQKENLDFQKTVADQRATQAVLKTAIERLAKYYSQEDLLQTGGRSAGKVAARAGRQTPPVQMEYKPNSGSTGVMQMIEKLIHEARELENDSRHSEIQAQAQYESLVADTNASVAALQKQVAEKTGAKAEAKKEKMETEGDLADTVKELEDLGQYNAALHGDCDYLLKNFGPRQEARAQEIEALQQAKQILSGASLS